MSKKRGRPRKDAPAIAGVPTAGVTAVPGPREPEVAPEPPRIEPESYLPPDDAEPGPPPLPGLDPDETPISLTRAELDKMMSDVARTASAGLREELKSRIGGVHKADPSAKPDSDAPEAPDEKPLPELEQFNRDLAILRARYPNLSEIPFKEISPEDAKFEVQERITFESRRIVPGHVKVHWAGGLRGALVLSEEKLDCLSVWLDDLSGEPFKIDKRIIVENV